MSELLSGPLALVLILGGWLLIQTVILPRLGMST
jgi:hypothetical protein